MKLSRIYSASASALAIAGLFCSSGLAQENSAQQSTPNTEVTDAATDAAESVILDADGNLVGKVFTTTDGVKTPLAAKVTLVKQDGEVVETVTADDDGVFAFQGVDPGAYQMFGASDGYVGQASYDVGSYQSTGCSSCDLGLQSAETVSYDQYAAAPASACGCGGAGGGGGGLGGGSLLNNRRLLGLGLIGGIVAIAVSDDDASPDE